MNLSTYVNKQLIVFTDNLNLASKNKNEEAIHDLRVALKRVFAIRHILKQTLTDYDLSIKPHFKPLKNIFNLTGIIRDHQLLIQNSHSRLSHNDYIQFRRICNSTIKNTHQKLFESLASISIQTEIRRVTKIFSILNLMRPEFIIETTLRLIETNDNYIQHEFHNPSCNFHNIRKWTKEQYYLYSLLIEFYKYNIDDSLIAKKKESGSKLGDWHDLRILHHHLSHNEIILNNTVLSSLEKETSILLEDIKTLL